MRLYLTKTPRLLRAAYSSCVWNMKHDPESIYITFDDGPCPEITDYVLEQLEKYNAKATFFCVGKNIEENSSLFEKIVATGHRVGNHTQNHLNGWKTDNIDYIKNINIANKNINSNLFRPPYGRITPSQIRSIKRLHPEMKIIMWDVLSGDFDVKLSPEKCLDIVIKQTKPGSIIVFHDSVKAFKRLKYVLPRFLKHCNEKGWKMKALT